MKAERCPRLGTRPLTALLAALLAGLCLFSLSVGASSLSPAQSLAALLGRGEDIARRIVLYVRLPRLLGALLAGSALALAGVLLLWPPPASSASTQGPGCSPCAPWPFSPLIRV